MSNKIRIAGIVEDSIVDGPGIRLTIFTQGCPHHCPGCHNPHTHDLSGGKMVDIDEIIKLALNNPLYSGVTFSGGEPLLQVEEVLEIAKEVKKNGLDTILYTGYIFEDLIEKSKSDASLNELLHTLDYIIDGPFIQNMRDLTLHFKGSSNQRSIDVARSLKESTIVLVDW